MVEKEGGEVVSGLVVGAEVGGRRRTDWVVGREEQYRQRPAGVLGSECHLWRTGAEIDIQEGESMKCDTLD